MPRKHGAHMHGGGGKKAKTSSLEKSSDDRGKQYSFEKTRNGDIES